MKKVLLFLFLGFITIRSSAQVDSARHITGGAIKYTKTFWTGKVTYTVGGIQASRKEVLANLISYGPSAKEDNIAAHYNTLAWVACGSALACFAASLITNDSSESFHTRSSKVFFGVGVGLIIPEFIFAGKRNRHFKNSIAAYNQQFK